MRDSLSAGWACCCVGDVSRSISRGSWAKGGLELGGAGLSCGPSSGDSPWAGDSCDLNLLAASSHVMLWWLGWH